MNLKQAAYRLAQIAGFARLARYRHRDRVAVLMYHGVAEDHEPLAQRDWLQVPASEFRAQMAFLARHYQVCRLDDILLGSAAQNEKPRAVITFDDGYANNLQVALPILQEFGLPASVFLVTSHIDTTRLFWWDRLYLACRETVLPDAAQIRALKSRSPRQIKAAVDAYLAAKRLTAPEHAPEPYRALRSDEIVRLRASGLIDFGSHTHGHEILAYLSDSEVLATLEVAAERLARWGLSARFFAAPNGDYLEKQIPLIQQAGHCACLSTRPGLWRAPADPFHIPRLDIGRGTTLDQFALRISGLKSWFGNEKNY